jgi:hypothetical protein
MNNPANLRAVIDLCVLSITHLPYPYSTLGVARCSADDVKQGKRVVFGLFLASHP